MHSWLLFAIILKNLIFLPLAKADYCEHLQPPQHYLELKSKIDEKLKTFSNNKIIAKTSDETLLKLIKAKSPFMASWLGKRNLESKSEEEIAKEWRSYYAKNFILTKYPQNEKLIDNEVEKLMESVNKLFSSKIFQNKMEKNFLQSKQASLAVIKNFPIKINLKNKIISRVESIKLYWMTDFKTSKFKQLPLDFLDWGIAYDPSSNEINMGINSLIYPNEETYLAVFAHEIGHSFDSCRWGAFFDDEWPFQKIGECLRSTSSIDAKKRDDSKLEEFVKQGKISTDLATSLKINSTCNKMIYPPIGTQADQLPESFADWFSAEVMSTLQNINPLNLRVDLCEKKDLSPGSSYPTNEKRLDNIYFAQPKFKILRSELKSNQVKYCDWN